MIRGAAINALRHLFVAAYLVSTTAWAAVPPIVVPSDIAVTLTATPTANLAPGQLIAFTLTVTNLGPSTVTDLVVQSSPIYGEFDLHTGTVDCQYMAFVVADNPTDFYYLYDWFMAGAYPGEFPAGETRTCHISFSITAQAPAVTTFSFGLPYDYIDPNPANDTATVTLRRAVAAVPNLSPMMMGLLALAIAAVAFRLSGVFSLRGKR